MMLVWPWILFERENCLRWILRTSSSQCYNNPVLVTPNKPPDHVKDFYDGQTYDLKTSVDIWTRVDVVPVEYGTYAQTFHLKIWFFWFITGITFKWDYLMWCIIALMVWIFLLTKLRIYRVPPDPVRWSCWGFVLLWREFTMIWMTWSKSNLKLSHMKNVNAPSNMKLVTSLIIF